MMNVLTTLHTGGDSLWSNSERRVDIVGFTADCNEEGEFGELRVYFDPVTWDTSSLGLIYTDSLFELELAEYLKGLGVDVSDLSYSEQGMQGDDYVSFDVGAKFIFSWRAIEEEVEEY